MNLKVTERVVDGVAVVDCSGRLIFGEEAAALRDLVKDLMLRGHRRILLNLEGVTYIDSGGLGALVGLFTSARAVGGEIKLLHLTRRVNELLQVTKLLTVFEAYDSEEQAVRSFGKSTAA